MKVIQRDLVLLGALGILIKENYSLHANDFIDGYDGEKSFEFLKHEIPTEEEIKKYLIEAAQQLYARIEKKFPENYHK